MSNQPNINIMPLSDSDLSETNADDEQMTKFSRTSLNLPKISRISRSAERLHVSDRFSHPHSLGNSPGPRSSPQQLDRISVDPRFLTATAFGETDSSMDEDSSHYKRSAFKKREKRHASNSNVRKHRNKSRSGWTTVNPEAFYIDPLNAPEIPPHDPKYVKPPMSVQGSISKKRKGPMKGWHIRYFYLSEGMLYYSRNRMEMGKLRLRGAINLQDCAINYKSSKRRIDIDTGHIVYHLKLKLDISYMQWLHKFVEHLIFARAVKPQDLSTFSYDMTARLITDRVESSNGHLIDEINAMSAENEKELSSMIIDMEKLLAHMVKSNPTKHAHAPEEVHRKASISSDNGSNPNSESTYSMDNTSHEKGHIGERVRQAFRRGRRRKSEASDSDEFISLAQSFVSRCKVVKTQLMREQNSIIQRTNTLKNKRAGQKLDHLNSESSLTPPFLDAQETFDQSNSTDSDTDLSSDELMSSFQEAGSYPGVRRSKRGEKELTVAKAKIDQTRNKYGRRVALLCEQPDYKLLDLKDHLTKAAIGRNMFKLSIPIQYNEPLSMLQHHCEELEHSDLLTKASLEDDPIKRMLHIVAFAISIYANTKHRVVFKPFNPIQFETFECVRPELGWKFVSEQVLHTPPTSAYYAEHELWTLYQEMRLESKFWGKSIEFFPIGGYKLKLKKRNETYRWSKVTSYIVNALISPTSRYIEHYGDASIVCEETEVACKMFLKKPGTFSSSGFRVNGSITLDDKRKIVGTWCDGIYLDDEIPENLIFKPNKIPAENAKYFNFTQLAMELNEEVDDEEVISGAVPYTDSRLRPDQRLLELGELEEATENKIAVEKRQREYLKQLDYPDGGKWFRKRKQPDGPLNYEFTHEYWKAKDNREFLKRDLPNIFQISVE